MIFTCLLEFVTICFPSFSDEFCFSSRYFTTLTCKTRILVITILVELFLLFSLLFVDDSITDKDFYLTSTRSFRT